MYSAISTTSKQALVWALMFILVLSVFPTTVADETDDEWFYDIYETVTDEDGDGYNDTVDIGYDPDTECDCDVNITVYVDIYDGNGTYIEDIYDEHTINNEEYDWFSQDWTPEESGTFDFHVYMYDEWNNLEDYWNVTGIELEPMTGSADETINVDNGAGDDNDDGVNNDMGFWASVKNDPVEDVEISIEYFNGVIWTYYTNGTTDEDGEYIVENMTDGEYRWEAEYDDDELEEGTVSYTEIASTDNISHDFFVDDWDGAGDYDDFVGYIFEGNDTKDDGYVEIYDEDGDLYDSGNTDEDYYGYDIYALYDVEEGNYTFNFYFEEDGELLQSGWLHSYGSSSTNNDEWFYDWDYDVYPNSTITIGYDPDTECDCNVTINVFVDIYNSNGTHVDSEYANHTIYNGYGDWFEQDWTADEDGVYDFYVSMYDEDWNEEDNFSIENVDLSPEYDEWIHAWTYYVPTDDDGNNNWNEIVVGYDPETECDCDVDVEVYLDVYDENGDWYAGSSNQSHTINGEQEDWFLQDIAVNEPGEYDFFVTMYDEDGNHEEDKSFSLIMSDEWFEYDWAVEDGNVKIDLQGNTNYDGEIDTYYEVNVYRWNEDENDWEEIDSYSDTVTISSGSPAPLHFEWEAEESGDYRFVVYMFDEMGQEDSFDFMEEINLNQAPVIEDLNVDHLFEGQLFNFEVDAFDADDDELEYTWDMGDGSSKKEGDSVRYGYQDDGVYTVTVWVSDGELTTDKEFQIVVENMAPALEVSFVDEADEGSELSFAAQVHDVASDDVTVTWTFADGSRVVGTFAQYTFRDNGEYLVVVVAEDEDGGTTMQQLLVTINNVAPTFTQFVMPSGGEEGEALDFMVSATDPGDDTITYTFDFGDDTAIMMTPDGNISHKFADGDTFTIVICAQDEDGGENCRTETLPVSILEQMEEEGLLPGFGVLGALSALGVIGILRRRTH